MISRGGEGMTTCHALSSAAPQISNQIPRVIRTSPSLSCIKHHLQTHYFTVSWDSNPLINCPHLRFMFILNAGVLTRLLHYITYIISNAQF